MKHLIASAAALALLAGLALPATANSRSEADRELYRRAQRECQSWKYMPDGASIYINYAEGWFRCDIRYDNKRNKHRGPKGGKKGGG